MKEKEKAQCEVTGNAERGGQTKVTVAVEISRLRKTSTRMATREGKGNDLRIRDAETAREKTGLEVLQHTTIKDSDNNPS